MQTTNGDFVAWKGSDAQMVERSFTLANATGLHLRPAALLVKTVKAFPGTRVTVRKGDKAVDATSAMSLMGLGAKAGEPITVACDGPEATAAMAAVAALIEGGFHG